MIQIFKRILVAIFTIIIAVQCANPGSPSGGPKDELPPVMLSAIPENSSTNFKSDKITIQFDELVKFKDLKKQLVISPPMKYAPIIKPSASAMDKVKMGGGAEGAGAPTVIQDNSTNQNVTNNTIVRSPSPSGPGLHFEGRDFVHKIA